MELEDIASLFLYAGSFVLLCGIVVLTYLQSKLIGRFNKSIFTFISVLFYPNHELTSTEIEMKKIGTYLVTAGSIIVTISGFFTWLTYK